MRVIKARDAFFSDYEALQFLSKLQRKHRWDENSLQEMKNFNKNKKGRFQKRPYNHPVLQGIVNDTLSYLTISKSIAATQDNEEEKEENEETKKKENEKQRQSPLTKLNDKMFTQLMNKLNNFELYKIEKLQIVNQLPTNMVHLFSIVEECDSRFTEDQINEMIELVASYVNI
ncbi:DNA-directed RNA polymerase III subunit RPC17 PWA37_003078 [Arxiozyma heterogenica]|uniref:DNA-directed RNA polymerase III subunit RPC9 n=1 Tax=Arxiozyma heterogenica TaxID=278026 RepID=A0AAN7ZRF9_9SACH|nr:hypothetical protein RI543_004709 [Kazachstania heterogenica]